ncbi:MULTISPECIES: PDR/VanB family oxidoreductase [Burkholderiaceae]|uniref:PDR/VanB family oxidoreductase n=1 Tax=Burkholderiaceae TaxID=119060 RepID=UPI00076B683F|nr:MULTISPECIES: PDR/VanB family oxidoreductase [Burkholderiaceae]AME28415.1 ferredoxin [Burkholderia sp. PAMC 26561]
MTSLRMLIQRIDALTPTIRRLLLVPEDGTSPPPFEAGAHIRVHAKIDGHTQRRAYSLVNSDEHADHYEIAVQLERTGTGGSKWVHQLEVGDGLFVDVPRNDFPLDHYASSYLLIAGGIGITAILSMARQLAAAGKSYELHYAGREENSMAYRAEVCGLANSTCWVDGGEPSRGIPLAGTLGARIPGRHLYVCGPRGLIDAVLLEARALGWPKMQLHSELFTAAQAVDDNSDFTVKLRASNVTLSVPANKSILDVMMEAGLDPLFDCRRGDCGVCTTQIVEGEADHRDICLSTTDRERGAFCPCVSRAVSPLLVLDL